MPYNVLSTELKNQIWLMYLRKSRQDDPNETVAEVLAKHETILQEWAKRDLGYEIQEEFIYREVVSGGESIDEREEMRKVISGVIFLMRSRLTSAGFWFLLIFLLLQFKIKVRKAMQGQNRRHRHCRLYRFPRIRNRCKFP